MHSSHFVVEAHSRFPHIAVDPYVDLHRCARPDAKITRAGLYKEFSLPGVTGVKNSWTVLFLAVSGEYKGWPLLQSFLYLA